MMRRMAIGFHLNYRIPSVKKPPVAASGSHQ